MATIKPRRGTSAPTAGTIIQNELAVDTTNKRIYIGAADGSGTLIGAAPAGSDTQVQFNDGGNLGGDSGLTYNKTTDTLTVTGDVAVNGGDLTTTSATATLFNSNATTLNIGSAATTVQLGATLAASDINLGNTITVSNDSATSYITRSGNGSKTLVIQQISGGVVFIGDYDNNINNGGLSISVDSLQHTLYGDLTISPDTLASTSGQLSVTSHITQKANGVGTRGELRFNESDNTHYVGFKAPATIAANKIWTLPSADGTSGQVLSTDGSGTLSWATASGGGSLDAASSSLLSLSAVNLGII